MTLDYGNYGIFLIMGNAGFISYIINRSAAKFMWLLVIMWGNPTPKPETLKPSFMETFKKGLVVVRKIRLELELLFQRPAEVGTLGASSQEQILINRIQAPAAALKLRSIMA